jgi:vacuolar protein sorting-associated protein 3
LSDPTFIEASRLEPAGHGNERASPHRRGVQNITILPEVSRASILCNGTISFYALPELSPAPNGREVHGCQWVGGLDLNSDGTASDVQELMIANARRITVVKVGEKIQGLKNIQYPGCLGAVRRNSIACVADNRAYALLEIEHQQKIPLFPISSLDESHAASIGKVEDLPSQDGSVPARGSSLAHRGPTAGVASAHSRSSSLSNFVSGIGKRQASPQGNASTRNRLASPDARQRNRSPQTAPSEDSGASSVVPNSVQLGHAASADAPASTASKSSVPVPGMTALLKPHVLSLHPNEFFLTTGTTGHEPGVGIFVNVDGDAVRGTIDFERYPESIALDKSTQNLDSSRPQAGEMEGILCAMMRTEGEAETSKGIRVYPLASEPSEMTRSSEWIKLPENGQNAGIQGIISPIDQNFRQVSDRLRLVRVPIPQPATGDSRDNSRLSGGTSTPDWENKRNEEETAFSRNFGDSKSQLMVWSQNNLFCLTSNPLLLQLEARLDPIEDSTDDRIFTEILDELRNRDARTETDFLSFNYIRQKASLLVFARLVSGSLGESLLSASLKTTENALIESNIDPRVIMLLLPLLREEGLQGSQGIWLAAGLTNHVEELLTANADNNEDVPLETWQMIRRYLATWQTKRGFGSISDEQNVFDSVDSALLRVLLHLEASLPRGSPAASAVRAKLNNVVDNWKGNFDRAVFLLEQHQRLFALSRLYQSRRLARDVLATWKRVVNGEPDSVGELDSESAETQIRRYLVNIRDTALVQEYALWLAQRNPDLAIEVFTDDKSRVKFPPPEVVQLLKKAAPSAVQAYLEYLVFNKGNTKYADDLIGYYLDSVLNVLESSESARDFLSQSYSTYRALEPPKPTYLSFIHEHAPPEPWWQSRLRLLQLLGCGNYASTSTSTGSDLTYSIPTVLQRLAPFSSYLVSESIILDARQGRHLEALRLLTHGLGDYDTAVRYCYFAGPLSSSTIIDESQLPPFETQKDLFNALLDEFLSIEDLSTRLERSSELLAKFAKWYDPMDVLSRIPDDWDLGLISEFLLRTMRALRSEMLEASVVKALSAAENLRKQAEFVEVCEKLGAKIEAQRAENGNNHPATGPRTDSLDVSVS